MLSRSDTDLIIAGVTIIQDDHGRYNLNALHQASGSTEAKKPGNWIKRASTRALQAELETQVSFLTLETIHGGERSGTYAHELLAVEYAGWISPAFRLKVNQAFIDSRSVARVPTLHDPKLQLLLDAIVHMDQLDRELAKAQSDIAAVKAYSEHVSRVQQWMTIRQYVFAHQLHAQMPLTVQQLYAQWLRDYCLEHGSPMYKAFTADRAWPDENTYFVGDIHETLPGWLKRHSSSLALVPKREETTP
jgi:hypothetical protein